LSAHTTDGEEVDRRVQEKNIKFVSEIFYLWDAHIIEEIYYQLNGQFNKIFDYLTVESKLPATNERVNAEDEFENFGDERLLECPILLQIMTDPVMCTDGFSYEREAIEKWLQFSNRSPMTNLELMSKCLYPDKKLKTAIQRYHQEH